MPMWTDEKDKELRKLWEADVSMEECMERFGLSERSIRARLGRLKIHRLNNYRLRQFTDDEMATFKAMWRDPSISLRVMAKRLRSSREAMQRMADRVGLGPRPERITKTKVNKPYNPFPVSMRNSSAKAPPLTDDDMDEVAKAVASGMVRRCPPGHAFGSETFSSSLGMSLTPQVAD